MKKKLSLLAFVTKEVRGEKNGKPSKTNPTMGVDLKQAINAVSKGLPLNLKSKMPVYHQDEQFMPKPQTLDLVDYEQLYKDNQKNLEEKRKKVKDYEQKKAEYFAKKRAEKSAERNEENQNH